MTYAEFFLDAPATTVELETLEISHPSFEQTYRIVKNAYNGLTATLEDDSEVEFAFYPSKITGTETRNNLDYALNIEFGDLGDVLPAEIDRIISDDSFATKPVLKYRTFRSDDLSEPMFGPVVLEIPSIAFNDEGAVFEAQAPNLNINQTGEEYALDRFPMLRGFL